MVQEGLSGEVTSDLRLQRSQRVRHVMMWGQGASRATALMLRREEQAGFCFWMRWQEAAAGERALEFQIPVHLCVLINFPILKSV